MILQKLAVICCVLVMLLAGYPQQSAAEELPTNSDFLSWNKPTQDWFIEAAIYMAGHIALLNNPDQGGCIWRWYYEDDGSHKKQIIESIRKFPDHTPTAVIIGLTQKSCGSLNYQQG